MAVTTWQQWLIQQLSLQGIPLATIGGVSAAAGGAIGAGYLPANNLGDGASPDGETGSGSASGSRNFFGRRFTPEVRIELTDAAGVGLYDYEGVPIWVYDSFIYGRYEYLPDGSLFRDPVSGSILNVNAEYWIYRAGGSDPGLLDPIDWMAGYGAARAFGYSARQ